MKNIILDDYHQDLSEQDEVGAFARQSQFGLSLTRMEDFFTTPDKLDQVQITSSSQQCQVVPTHHHDQQQPRLQQRLSAGSNQQVQVGSASPPTPPVSPKDLGNINPMLTTTSVAKSGNGGSSDGADPHQSEHQAQHERFIHSGSWELSLRHTLAYWVAVAFATGSLMFILGGLSTVYDLSGSGSEKNYETSFVTAPYVVGGLFYTVGCYAGFLAVVNLGRGEELPFRFWALMANRRAWWATGCYTVGGLLFNVSTLADSSPVLANATSVVGSVLFCVGAALEVAHNDGFKHFRPRKLAFWSSWFDLVGSALFLAGSLCGTAALPAFNSRSSSSSSSSSDSSDSPMARVALAYSLCYVVGSAFFLGSSLAGLWMWKLEQFGNTYLPELNTNKPSSRKAVRSYQLFFVLVYASILTLAVTGISLSVECGYDAVRTQDQVLRVFIPLGLLALGSATHSAPEVAPFSYLLWWFRVAMLYQLCVESLEIGTICEHRR